MPLIFHGVIVCEIKFFLEPIQAANPLRITESNGLLLKDLDHSFYREGFAYVASAYANRV